MENLGGLTQNDNAVLLMLSGGRDSFLSACRLIEDGWCVHMITYDNGCISNVEQAQKVAERIVATYGENCAKFVGIYSITANLYRLQQPYLYTQIKDSSQHYPYLRPAQIPCLACHTGMYVVSIAYCKAHGILRMAEGARESQKFFVELPEMIQRYKDLTRQNGIDLLLPVYNLTDDWERKLCLAEYGFIPKTTEPQCWLGYPLGDTLNSSEIRSLVAYYDDKVAPQLPKLIETAVKKLSLPRSMHAKGLQ